MSIGRGERAQPVGGDLEDGVAGAEAERVVDILEAVEVDAVNPEQRAARAGLDERA